jgi:large subunit ribosomal protein L3
MKFSRPRRGSLAFHPRKRAARPVPRIRAWPSIAQPILAGFPCYKAGTTHVILVDDRKYSKTYGEEIATQATVLEAPPVKVFGARGYVKDNGLRAAVQVFASDLSKDLGRCFPLPKKQEQGLDKIKEMADELAELRAFVHTQPRLTSVPKKKPDIFEVAIGGKSIEEKIKVLEALLGKEVKISDVFKEGDYVDTCAITKGKGFQSPVKRWGVKILHHKTRKGRRTAGTLGPWRPRAVMWTVPQSGQMGYHQRTEYNKRVLKIGSNGSEVVPKGGFLHYGLVKGDYIILKGSTQGPAKRLVFLRHAVRPPKKVVVVAPKLTYISTESKQGV